MRRIYESDALSRDDDDPFSPTEDDDRSEPRAARTLPVERITRALTTHSLRCRALGVAVHTPEGPFAVGDRVPFAVAFTNPLPVPLSVETVSPLRWTWAVDGHREAVHHPEEPPAEPRRFVFDRGERKQFSRGWDGHFRVSGAEWEPATAGEYTLSVAINVADPEAVGLTAETTVTLE